MIPARHLPPIAAFGPYTVDLETGEICKFGLRLKTGEQPFQILVLLLQRRGQLVTREEIRRRLWGNRTFVDFDHSLNSAIQRLRDCLCDSAAHARWIETVPRRGYRFIGHVEWRDPSRPPSRTGVLVRMPAVAATEPRRRGVNLTLAAAVLVLLFFAYRAISGSAAESPSSIHSIAVLPLENASGEPAQNSLATQFTSDLAAALTKERSIRVVSPASAAGFQGTHRPVREIGRELHVDAVVEGSVARAGGELHATTRLIDCRTDTSIWAGSFERDVTEAAPLLTEIERNITSYASTPAHEE